MDKFPHQSEYAPLWKPIDPKNPPKGRKMLFKEDEGPACIGVWYPESRWTWYCGLPKHSEDDKALIRTRSSSTSGRYANGKPYGEDT